MIDYVISDRIKKKGTLVVARPSPEVQRGYIIDNGQKVPAIRFRSGIVHEYKSRRGVRVSRALAKTFVPEKSDS